MRSCALNDWRMSDIRGRVRTSARSSGSLERMATKRHILIEKFYVYVDLLDSVFYIANTWCTLGFVTRTRETSVKQPLGYC